MQCNPCRAAARLNQIHGMYKSITNEEFLYVLTTFVVLPVRTINKYGWRRWVVGWLNGWVAQGCR